jgi:hypothetical protein
MIEQGSFSARKALFGLMKHESIKPVFGIIIIDTLLVLRHSFRLILLRGGKNEGRKSPKPKEKRSLKKYFFALEFSLWI